MSTKVAFNAFNNSVLKLIYYSTRTPRPNDGGGVEVHVNAPSLPLASVSTKP